ncbi:MAG: 2-C-methyl-D-erythritol 4-phosphate cytidylyltransferase [Clostridia bacterium]|nr:2-C-methyl-D-erythritol 4-phosphate cytidylyltransferase [Clostridia bacterium]
MNIGVIFAGGVGNRMSTSDTPKQFLEVDGKPIIIYTLEPFENNAEIDAIVVSCIKDKIDYLKSLLVKFNIRKVKGIVEGGKTGQLSIYNGLKEAEKIADGNKSIVLIHDGVRPLITSELLSESIKNVKQYGSSITSNSAKETVIVVDDENNMVDIPDRAKVRIAKAPQCFYLDEIMNAHNRALKENKISFVDSCSLMKYYGGKPFMAEGPYDNIKITTQDDFYTIKAIIEEKTRK